MKLIISKHALKKKKSTEQIVKMFLENYKEVGEIYHNFSNILLHINNHLEGSQVLDIVISEIYIFKVCF